MNMSPEEMASQSREWWMDMGTINKERGDYATAEAFYRGAVAKDRNYGDAWFNLGSLLLQNLGRPKDALYCLEEAIRCNPEDEVARRFAVEARRLM